MPWMLLIGHVWGEATSRKRSQRAACTVRMCLAIANGCTSDSAPSRGQHVPMVTKLRCTAW